MQSDGSGSRRELPPGTPNGALLSAFLELRPLLRRYLRARGATADETDDVLQETSLKLSMQKTGPVDQPKAYLYRMAHNEFLSLRRTGTRRSGREADWMESAIGDPPEMEQRRSVEASLIAREQLAMLQAALDDLPDRTRLIFTRFRLDGAPQKDIAAEFGISVSAIEKHLTRAYEKIARARLQFDGAGAPPRYLKGTRGGDES